MTSGLWKNRNGSTIEYFAVAAGLIATLALFVGYSAQQLASDGDLPTIALLNSDQYIATKARPPSFNTIDYATTGSVGRGQGQVIVLDPCTGRQKSD
jgi:hypothetical protein